MYVPISIIRIIEEETRRYMKQVHGYEVSFSIKITKDHITTKHRVEPSTHLLFFDPKNGMSLQGY